MTSRTASSKQQAQAGGIDISTLYSLVDDSNDKPKIEVNNIYSESIIPSLFLTVFMFFVFFLQRILSGLGGPKGLAKALGVDPTKGIKSSEVDSRAETYGRNDFAAAESQSWMDLFFESFEDTTVIVLIVSAVVSLVVGLIEDLAKGWIEGTAILAAVLIVAVVTATNNYEKEKQFQKLNAVKDDIHITVIRGGATVKVNTKNLVVGDVVELNSGDKIPADGVILSGSDIGCDESSLTGEPELVPKGDEDHVLLSGTNLGSGCCSMLVICVGDESRWGKLRATLSSKAEDTPLQEKLDALAGQIGNGGMLAAGATFLAMLFVFFYYPDPSKPTRDNADILEYTLKAFIMAVTIVVVAVPEGLPLAVTLSLAFSTQKMMADNNLIRVLSACETMGNATNICSDKTGTLTQNRMTVVEGWVASKYREPFPSSREIPQETSEFIVQNMSVNSTANLVRDDSKSNEIEVLGSKTEGALLLLLNAWGLDYSKYRAAGFDAERGDKLFTFSSARKTMSALVNSDARRGKILYTKGASEVVLKLCNFVMDGTGAQTKLDAKARKEIESVINDMARKSLRTFALAHRIVSSSVGALTAENLEQDLVLDCIVGIKDPLRPDVTDAVRTCQEAGILVRMVTGDNLETARSIARECGILTDGGLCMEGPEFRTLKAEERDRIIPQLQVLARSTPTDKLTLVQCLNGHHLSEDEKAAWEEARGGECAEVVGVTGDGTNDAPALKAADVGLSMGMCGTEGTVISLCTHFLL